jgi:hypothetical protein
LPYMVIINHYVGNIDANSMSCWADYSQNNADLIFDCEGYRGVDRHCVSSRTIAM